MNKHVEAGVEEHAGGRVWRSVADDEAGSRR